MRTLEAWFCGHNGQGVEVEKHRSSQFSTLKGSHSFTVVKGIPNLMSSVVVLRTFLIPTTQISVVVLGMSQISPIFVSLFLIPTTQISVVVLGMSQISPIFVSLFLIPTTQILVVVLGMSQISPIFVSLFLIPTTQILVVVLGMSQLSPIFVSLFLASPLLELTEKVNCKIKVYHIHNNSPPALKA